MNIWAFGLICAISLFGAFEVAGYAYEENSCSPAAILFSCMVFSGIICGVLTWAAMVTFGD